MEKKKLVDDKNCILAELEDGSKAVGFKCWLDGFYTEKQIASLIRNSTVIEMTWPKSNVIHPARKMITTINKMTESDWYTCKVKVLDIGEWCKMFESMQLIEKTTRLHKNKLSNDTNINKDNNFLEEQLGEGQAKNVNNDPILTGAEAITQTVDKPKKNKHEKKDKPVSETQEILDEDYLPESTDTEKKKRRKKKKKTITDIDENEELDGVNEDLPEMTITKKKKKKKHSKKEKTSEKTVESKSDDEIVDEVEKKLPDNTVAESKNGKSTRKADDGTDKPNDETSDENNATNFPGIESNTIDLTNKSDLTGAQSRIGLNTGISLSNIQNSSFIGDTKKSEKNEKKKKDAAKKSRALEASETILSKLQSKSRKRSYIDSEDCETESVTSGDEAPRKRTKAQLESDISILKAENKELRNQLFIYRSNDKTQERSKDLLENLKNCDRTLKKLSFTCQKCQNSQTLRSASNFSPQPLVVSDTSGTSNIAQDEKQKTNAPNVVKNINQSQPENNYSDLIDETEPAAESSVNNDLPHTQNTTFNYTSEEPMTDIGEGVQIATSILARFRKEKVRHYLLDMMNAAYTPTEFAQSSKSGRLGRNETEKKKQPLDPNKQKAIVAYTASLFPKENIDELNKQFATMLMNKCRNTCSTLKYKAVVKVETPPQTEEK